ncbi:MAG: ATP-binding protein [Chitinophagaceae bacterium]|nr:ATP-binding protein [Chitinophagaceae bacterium]
MYSEIVKHYTVLVAGLVFLSLIMAMFLLGIFFQYRLRLQEYALQLTREIELIDAERKRIHIDLHDEIGAGLASVGILIQQQPCDDRVIQEKITNQIITMRARRKEIAYDLVPIILDTQGLYVTIRELASEMGEHIPIAFVCNTSISDKQFNPVKATHIYRIIKEAFANAITHANCTKIHCIISNDSKQLQVQVADNGSGFNKQIAPKKGTGISHIYVRAKILHAKVNLESTQQKGTVYKIQIPIEALQ